MSETLPNIVTQNKLVAGGNYVYCHTYQNLGYGKAAYDVIPTKIKNFPNDAVTILFEVDETQYEIVTVEEETVIVGDVVLRDYIVLPFTEFINSFFK